MPRFSRRDRPVANDFPANEDSGDGWSIRGTDLVVADGDPARDHSTRP